MTYDQLKKKLMNDEEISEQEAMEYLGEDICNEIKNFYSFCKENNYNIFTHGSIGDIDDINSMFEKGYLLRSSTISEKEFIEKTGIKDYKSELDKMKYYTEDNERIYAITLKPSQKQIVTNRIMDDMDQHFCRGRISYKGIIGRFVARYYGYPCNLMFFFVTPKDKTSSQKIYGTRYTIEYDDKEGNHVYFSEGNTIATEVIAMCIDVEEKKVYHNKYFDPKYLDYKIEFVKSDMFIDWNNVHWVDTDDVSIQENIGLDKDESEWVSAPRKR